MSMMRLTRVGVVRSPRADSRFNTLDNAVYVNVSAIVVIERYQTYTHIECSNGSIVTVREMPEEILASMVERVMAESARERGAA